MRQFGKCGFRVSRILVCHKEPEDRKEKGDARARKRNESKLRDAAEEHGERLAEAVERERERGHGGRRGEKEAAVDEPAADKYSSLTDDVGTSPPPRR